MQNQKGNLTAISFSSDIFASYFLGETKVGLLPNGEREGGSRTLTSPQSSGVTRNFVQGGFNKFS